MADEVAPSAGAAIGASAPGPTVRAPTRPMWNPAEDARKRAELALAAVATNGASGASGARPVGGLKAPHHTVLPRLMVLVSLVGSLVSIFANQLLVRLGEATEVAGKLQFSPLGRLLWIGVVGGSAGAYLAGWVWWTAAAAANARHKTRKAGSAASAPVAHAVVFALIGALSYFAPRSDDVTQGVLLLFVLGIWAAAHLGMLMMFRRKADAIKAPVESWRRMLWLPFAASVTAGSLLRLSNSQDMPMLAIAGAAIALALVLWYLVSVASAMKSFDEACRTPAVGRADGEVPDFMRMAMVGR